jgi:hypothetical protein
MFMRHLVSSLCLCGALVGASSIAKAQSFSGSYGTSGGSYSGYAPQRNDVDNVGEDGQFIFAIERITALNFDRVKISYTDEATDTDFDSTAKTTNLSLLGVDPSSPAQLPRFALDYVVASGISVGGSIMFVTRSLSEDDVTVAPVGTRVDGSTFLAGARVGYAFPFDETFGIWPRAGLSYALATASSDLADEDGEETEFSQSTHYFDLNLEALAVISPVEHIAIMAGPYLDLGLGGKHKVEQDGTEIDSRNANLTSFGLVIHAGGYY